jgi:telomere length regulation protein
VLRTLIDGLDRIVGSLTSTLLEMDSTTLLADFVSQLKPFEQRKYLSAVIACLVEQYFASDVLHHNDVPLPTPKSVCGVAKLLHTLIKDNDGLKDHLVSVLTRSTIPSLDDSLAARRSIMAAIAQDEGEKIRGSLSHPHIDDKQTNCIRYLRTV